MTMDQVPQTDGLQRLSRRDFDRLARFIHGTSGIKMPPSKQTMVEGRLRRRLRALGFPTFGDYCQFLFDDGGLDGEATAIIDAVTTNKTDFFREPDHFRYLSETTLPQVIARSGAGVERPLKVWSAACSTGAEPYTLAMVLSEYARNRSRFHSAILATDICTEVLERAALAIYPAAMVDPVPVELRRKYLLRARDPRRGEVRMAPEIRTMVRFGQLNLMNETYGLDHDMDVIFCRNLLIYFDKDTQQRVLGRLCEHLRPGGHLFLGHSETIAGLKLPLRQVATTVFERN